MHCRTPHIIGLIAIFTLVALTPQGAANGRVPSADPPAGLPVSISQTSPSSSVNSPAPLHLGEIVTGRLDDGRSNGKAHFWSVRLPAGTYELVLDVKRADDQQGDVGGDLQWYSTDGVKENDLGGVDVIDVRARGVVSFTSKKPIHAIIRYMNFYTVSDYWLGLYKAGAHVRSPFFVNCPAVSRIELGQEATSQLDGSQPKTRDVYYLVALPPGDFKVSLTCALADGQRNDVGGRVDVLDRNGVVQNTLVQADDIDVSTKKVVKLSLADPKVFILRVRAYYAPEKADLLIDHWSD